MELDIFIARAHTLIIAILHGNNYNNYISTVTFIPNLKSRKDLTTMSVYQKLLLVFFI
jgi:hypothetical protein